MAGDRREGRRSAKAVGVEIHEDLFQFHALIRMHGGKFQTEGVAFNPANLRFIDPQWPAQPRGVVSSLNRSAGYDRMIRLDAASSIGQIERFPLSLALPSRKCAAELSREPRMRSLFR
jgi:hypothetical protein